MQSRKPQAPIITLAFLLIANITANAQAPKTYMTVPAGNEYTHLDTAGVSVLPSGRLLTPAGRTIRIAHDPFGMAVSPDGSKTVTLHNGVFTVIDNATLKNTPNFGSSPSREVFDADAALKKFHRNIDWRKVKGGVGMDDEADQRKLMRTGDLQ